MGRARFSYLWYLFAFEGRINRARYWAHAGLVMLVIFPGLFGIGMLASAVERLEDPAMAEAIEAGLGLLVLAIFLPLVISVFAVGAKRWHDRNRSGWWVLINLIPLIGPIWTIVECGCMKGTEGPNRHGPDPLAPPVETVFD